MLHTRQALPLCGGIAGQLVRNNYSWHVLQALEKFAEKSFGGLLVTTTLHKDIKHIPFLIHRLPQIVSLATDREKHLIHMPRIATARAMTTQLVGVRLPKFEAPLTHRFVGDDDPALGQKLFDIAKTEREAEIQPHSMA